jgi:hypothetical protein
MQKQDKGKDVVTWQWKQNNSSIALNVTVPSYRTVYVMYAEAITAGKL